MLRDVLRELERIKWFLWHGNVFQALQDCGLWKMTSTAMAYESETLQRASLKAVQEFPTYIEHNGGSSPTMASATVTASGSAQVLWNRR